MAYGTLTLITGPMFAGKSTELLKDVLWAMNGERHPVAVLKPAFDTRYGVERIVSHDGLSAEALPIAQWPEFEKNIRHVFIDEVQFREAPRFEGDLVASIRQELMQGRHVTASGLDMDFMGRPFMITAALLAMADKIIKKTAHCTICGRPATKTFRLGNSTNVVELGESDKYEARCNDHWIAPLSQ